MKVAFTKFNGLMSATLEVYDYLQETTNLVKFERKLESDVEVLAIGDRKYNIRMQNIRKVEV